MFVQGWQQGRPRMHLILGRVQKRGIDSVHLHGRKEAMGWDALFSDVSHSLPSCLLGCTHHKRTYQTFGRRILSPKRRAADCVSSDVVIVRLHSTFSRTDQNVLAQKASSIFDVIFMAHARPFATDAQGKNPQNLSWPPRFVHQSPPSARCLRCSLASFRDVRCERR